jgi:hypothetical protein
MIRIIYARPGTIESLTDTIESLIESLIESSPIESCMDSLNS